MSYKDSQKVTPWAMTDKDWLEYVEKHGHPPTWHPHEGSRKLPKESE